MVTDCILLRDMRRSDEMFQNFNAVFCLIEVRDLYSKIDILDSESEIFVKQVHDVVYRTTDKFRGAC